MRRIAWIGVAAPLVAAFAVVIGFAAAASEGKTADASAVAVRVSVPGQAVMGTPVIGAPPSVTQELSGWAFPDGGSIVRLGPLATAVSASTGASISAESKSSITSVSIFSGEVTVETLELRAWATVGAARATSEPSLLGLTGLSVLGRPVDASTNQAIQVEDWGVLSVLDSQTTLTDTQSRTSATGLRLRLIADHGGLPSGSMIEVGTVEATATAASTPRSTAPTEQESPPSRNRPLPQAKPASPNVLPSRAGQEPGATVPGAPDDVVRPIPNDVQVTPSTKGYVFPIYGRASYGDTFGAFRADVSGQWHHGEDVVAPRDTPLLAVADGTVFSVGWNTLGGWRLWLRDRAGNEFYYAHMSAYSPLAVEGRQVRAGDVLGFVGRTGDAENGPFHLHFEIHPAELLALGYDGVVAPYPFLTAWELVDDIPFGQGRRYLPNRSGALRSAAQPGGAVLLETHDISHRSGLTPGGLTIELDNRATHP